MTPTNLHITGMTTNEHRFATSIAIDAPPERVWAIMRDVERWHEWTSTVTSVRLIGGGTLAVGRRALIRQPKLPPAVWKVVEVDEGREFTWVSGLPGMWSTARHVVEPRGATCEVVLSITYSGMLGSVLARIFGDITDRYLAIEAAGLKQRTEAAP